MKLGLINSAWVQADQPTVFGLRKTKQIGFDTVDIAIDPAGYIYLLDQDRAQVAVFDAFYRFIALLGPQELGNGAVAKPISLDVDASGDLYIFDDKEKTLVRLQ